ncbi:MAG: glycosyltransferase [Armatimonadia bacterium]|nr:glycosyltransferase [Armatimonadia bacterium]
MIFGELSHSQDGLADHAIPRPCAAGDWSLRDPAHHAGLNGFRVEIGCGDRPRPGFIHVDPRPLPHVEVLGTLQDIPLPNGCADETFAAHVIEHVPEAELGQAIRELRRVLKPGGRVLLRGPDVLRQYGWFAEGGCDADALDLMIGGHQDHSENVHRSWHTAERVAELLHRHGFEGARILDPDRDDGWEAWDEYPEGRWATVDFLVEARKPVSARTRLTLSSWPHLCSLTHINERLIPHLDNHGYETTYHIGWEAPGVKQTYQESRILGPASQKLEDGDVWISHAVTVPPGKRMLKLAILPCDCTLMNRRLMECYNRECQAVATPSAPSAEILYRSGLDVPIDVIPNAVDCRVFRPDGAAADLPGEGTFRIFTHCYYQHRKGLDIILSAFVAAFSAADDVTLVLKDGGAYEEHRLAVERLVAEALSGQPNAPRIEMISGHVPETEMAAMLRAADCYVSASRIEGFGIPPLEALATGTPAIVPGFGGHTDFVDDRCGYVYPIAGMERVPEDFGTFHLFDPRGEWGIPDQQALAEAMRHAYENPAEAQAKGIAGREVALAYDWPKVLDAYSRWIAFRLEHGVEGEFDWRRPPRANRPAPSPPRVVAGGVAR